MLVSIGLTAAMHGARLHKKSRLSTAQKGPRLETWPSAPRAKRMVPRPRCIGPRQRRWGFCPRRDRDETSVGLRLETVSRPGRRYRDHISGCLTRN